MEEQYLDEANETGATNRAISLEEGTETKDEKKLTEAPASVTYSIVTPNGYPALFTLREFTGKTLMQKMKAVEAQFAKEGFKPQERGYRGGVRTPIEYVEGKVCPICKGRVVKKHRRDTNAEFWQCENKKYDFQTKQSSGCSYVDWKAGKGSEEKPPEDEF